MVAEFKSHGATSNDETSSTDLDSPSVDQTSGNRNYVHGKSTTYANVDEVRYYKPVETYEGLHRWDPEFEWTEAEEKKLVRKLDWRICSFCCLMFFSLQLDRGNISQALSDNLLNDLGLTTNDYNTGQTIFYISFLFAELPSQLISKKLGPDVWIPIQMVSWSLVAASQAFLTGRASYFACRSLLAVFEGGFIPDMILYMSYFFTSTELPRRLSYFWSAYQFTSIVSAFLAFGILRLRGYHNMAGWRWLFALEGLLTGILGVVAFFYLPPSPTQTASKFRGKDGWFNEREEKIMVNRVIRDDPSKGDMHNRQGLSFTLLREAIWDYDMWPIYLLGLSWLIPNSPAQSYLTLQLKSLGFDVFQTNLLTIPAYVGFILNCLLFSWISERFNERFLLGVVTEAWCLVLLIAAIFLPADASAWARWVISTLLVSAPYIHPIIVAITSRNAGSVRTRTVASAIYNMMVQTSSIISSNIYRDNDKPLYRTGNKALAGIASYNIILYFSVKMYYVWKNKSREKIWNSMSESEKQHYLDTTTDKGNKRLDFRFAH
ncbi:major facilitator superfamily domain-containing protein [Mariannaea sp. PMI_226]|nr:major facilitator superfamily domain-containing protein [Mariannaea sp. PMI_226]